MQAASYVRVSTDRQADEDRTSLEEQTAAIDAFAAAHDLDVVARYRDVASGTSRTRPDFRRLLADVRTGEVSAVVCWKSDRLFREIGGAADLLDAIKEAPTPVRTARRARYHRPKDIRFVGRNSRDGARKHP